MSNKTYIGLDSYESYIYQETNPDGMIRGFNCYNLVELVNGDMVLSIHAWTHNVEIGGVKYSTGMLGMVAVDLPEEIQNAYECDTISCEECGANHNSDDSTWAIVGECTAVCLGCRSVDQVLIPLDSPESLFKSKNLDDLDLSGFEKIETLFCDSSGFGGDSERALTKKQAELEVNRIIEENQGIELFCGLTGIGQFQVYVTVFKRAA